jgi:hypothetical protein
MPSVFQSSSQKSAKSVDRLIFIEVPDLPEEVRHYPESIIDPELIVDTNGETGSIKSTANFIG